MKIRNIFMKLGVNGITLIIYFNYEVFEFFNYRLSTYTTYLLKIGFIFGDLGSFYKMMSTWYLKNDIDLLLKNLSRYLNLLYT